jgi:hypothetical protein
MFMTPKHTAAPFYAVAKGSHQQVRTLANNKEKRFFLKKRSKKLLFIQARAGARSATANKHVLVQVW